MTILALEGHFGEKCAKNITKMPFFIHFGHIEILKNAYFRGRIGPFLMWNVTHARKKFKNDENVIFEKIGHDKFCKNALFGALI